MMKQIMKRAWEIYRTLVGDKSAKMSMALRQAWAEAKATVKEVFEGFAKIARCADPYDECCYYTFKLWEKGGHKRVYINDYKRRTLGYIENGTLVTDYTRGTAREMLDYAVNAFTSRYAF